MRPNSATVSPFVTDRPVSEPTMVRPNTASMNSSAFEKARISGSTRGSDTDRTTAPNTPPKAETVKAAPSARAACPCFASG